MKVYERVRCLKVLYNLKSTKERTKTFTGKQLSNIDSPCDIKDNQLSNKDSACDIKDITKVHVT